MYNMFVDLRSEIMELPKIDRGLCEQSPGEITGSDLWDLRVLFSDGSPVQRPSRGDFKFTESRRNVMYLPRQNGVVLACLANILLS